MARAKPGLGDSTERYVAELIEVFVRQSPLNRLHKIDNGPIFEGPLVGFADGDDPLFEEYKTIIGPFHLTPGEAIQQALAEQPEAAHRAVGKLGIICWILPIAKAARVSNRARKYGPSKRWAHTKQYGEQFNDALRDHVVAMLRARGYLAIAPVRSSLFHVYRDNAVDHHPASTWSERHIQYVAGLGTFSLSDGFITPKGIAMRCGSVVTNLPLNSTRRTRESHVSNCLFLVKGLCGECIQRCPAGAITERGHDKLICQEYLRQDLHLLEEYQVNTAGCGLCQTGVPCEAGIPE